jgi:hypothetical protein
VIGGGDGQRVAHRHAIVGQNAEIEDLDGQAGEQSGDQRPVGIVDAALDEGRPGRQQLIARRQCCHAQRLETGR